MSYRHGLEVLGAISAQRGAAGRQAKPSRSLAQRDPFSRTQTVTTDGRPRPVQSLSPTGPGPAVPPVQPLPVPAILPIMPIVAVPGYVDEAPSEYAAFADEGDASAGSFSESDAVRLFREEGIDPFDLEATDESLLGYITPEKSFLVTPGTMKDEMDKVLREGNTLDADVKASKADPNFKAAWQSFWDGYKRFYADNAQGVGGWASRLWSSTYKQTTDYGNQLNDWRAKLQSYGARVTEPKATPRLERESDSSINWKYVLAAGGAIGGLAVVGYVLSKSAALAGAVRGRR